VNGYVDTDGRTSGVQCTEMPLPTPPYLLRCHSTDYNLQGYKADELAATFAIK